MGDSKIDIYFKNRSCILLSVPANQLAKQHETIEQTTEK
jgi:hypothetical protein